MKERRLDLLLVTVAIVLAVFGVAMVYSASAVISMRETQSQFTYFYKQLMFSVIGIGIMLIVSRIDYRRLQQPLIVYGGYAVTAACLLAVFAFPAINGASRWIRFGGFSFQPSEMAKIALPIFLAYFLTKNEETVGEASTAIISLAAFGFFAVLIMLEPDLGTTMVLAAVFGAIYFAAGARLLHIAIVGGLFLTAGVAAIVLAPWRVERFMAFLDPFAHADDAGYQVVQSLYAIGSGGIAGEGFAKGQAKLFYLPYPYSDFIFSVVGEELGLIGTLAVVTAFGVILWRGTRAALMAPDRFGMLLGIGIVTGIVVQALFNISVVISIVPAKGIPLPFISYGGSSVMLTLLAIGILLSISRYSGTAETAPKPAKAAGSVHRRKLKKAVQK